MPALSVVVVVHLEQAHVEQAYVEECVRSVLASDRADVEIVAVDDAAPNHGPQVLDDLAAHDARVRVVHLDDRAGPGPARERGLEAASGEFVWFADPTDVLMPGGLDRVLTALGELRPDVLLVDHEHEGPTGRTRPGPHRRRLGELAAAGPGPLDARPAAAAAAPCAFDKVLRRTLLDRPGVGFADGGHPELTVTWPALLGAERVAAMPGAVYVRRPRANATPGPPRAHLDLFARYDAVHAFLDTAEAPVAARRPLVLPAMVAQGLSLADRVAEGHRDEFVRRLVAAVQRHRRGDETLPDDLRTRLVLRGDVRALALLRAADRRADVLRRGRAGLARRRRRAVAAIEGRRTDRFYAARRREPLDPDLAVFAAYWNRGFSCNPRAIYEKARELVPGFRGVWVVTADRAGTMPPDVEHVVAGSREYFDVLARASYFVNNVNFPNHLVKRPGTTHVMTHHGTPLKRMGLDLRDTPVAGRRMDFDALLRRSARWDFSISSNPLSTLHWERVFPLRHETLEVGYPRNDRLATAGADEVARLREGLGIAPGQTAVLHTPTHREYRKGYVPDLDLAAVAAGLGEDHVLLARTHYFYDAEPKLRELHRQGRVHDVAAHPSIEDLMLAADVLITDYSSIMFDFAVLDRPIVIHAPDWEVYRAMRGTTFDLMAEPPGVVTRTEDELVAALRSGAVAGEPAGRDRAAFRARFCPWDDGRASERVVRRVWLGERDAAVASPAEIAR